MSTTKEQRADCLNSLLRGEISAVETYGQALEKVGDDPRAGQLRQFKQEHEDAVTHLRQHVQAHTDEKPAADSGWWGSWAKTVTGAAKLFGDKAALKALREGEEHGAKQYEEALGDGSLTESCKSLIRATLLPRTRAHIDALGTYIDSK